MSFRTGIAWGGTDEFCSRLGPFVSTPRRAMEEDMSFTRSAIAVTTGFQCKPLGRSMEGRAAATARVAAVFRYVPPWEHQPTAAQRSGMSSMALSAEGVWIPSTGQVCMVGRLPGRWRGQGSMRLPRESLRPDDDADDSPEHHRRSDHRDGREEPPSALVPATRGPLEWWLQPVAAAHVVLLHQGPTGSGAPPSTPSGISQQLRCQVHYSAIQVSLLVLLLPMMRRRVSPTSPTILIFVFSSP